MFLNFYRKISCVSRFFYVFNGFLKNGAFFYVILGFEYAFDVCFPV